MKLYEVGEIASWGYRVKGTYYTFDIKQAKNEFARRVWQARRNGGLSMESREGHAIKRGSQAHEKAMMSITYWIYVVTSNENGTEYHEDPQEICLWEDEVEDAGLTVVNAKRLAALERLYAAQRSYELVRDSLSNEFKRGLDRRTTESRFFFKALDTAFEKINVEIRFLEEMDNDENAE